MTAGDKMAALLILFLLGCAAPGLRAQLRVCSSCRGGVRNSSEVAHLCIGTPGADIMGRCCVNKTESSIIGLDLWNCSISHLDPDFHLTAAVMVIDLSQNPLQELRQDFFLGLTGLQYLALPLSIDCPGGKEAWGNIEERSGARICQEQQSICNTTGGEAVLCPENSQCAPDGPGLTQCICAGGFRGYKCLREGHFPTLMFFGILSSVTVTLTVLLWCTQRRKVKSL
ncbi:all-trans retinoic acid-induced differentiation factor [Hyperolius riggenbachi]|uniref:all-trans retinoic acid-induced differentiation factor n=1 Tax=Hyperolius riggenbachi TaxID=752182 RepID=UPI0035A275B9